ncbi:hypothetical protein [Streptomyces sp. NPDC051286]|uniref:hypothetical protein n=1 Tax=Streptomyces sp. NPDC051286 TaxID=3365647 RepID=UPI003797F9F3
MLQEEAQVRGWDAAATTKQFTHPLHTPWLEGVSRHATVLGYGCGYGRTLDALAEQGFVNQSTGAVWYFPGTGVEWWMLRLSSRTPTATAHRVLSPPADPSTRLT